MSKVIRVKKPFVFNFPTVEGQPHAGSKTFEVGDHEVEADVHDHPWIAAGADGHIASDEEVAAEAAAAAAAAEVEETAKAKRGKKDQ